MTREPGFYWVRSLPAGDVVIARLVEDPVFKSGMCWLWPGSEVEEGVEYVEVLSERLVPPATRDGYEARVRLKHPKPPAAKAAPKAGARRQSRPPPQSPPPKPARTRAAPAGGATPPSPPAPRASSQVGTRRSAARKP